MVHRCAARNDSADRMQKGQFRSSLDLDDRPSGSQRGPGLHGREPLGRQRRDHPVLPGRVRQARGLGNPREIRRDLLFAALRRRIQTDAQNDDHLSVGVDRLAAAHRRPGTDRARHDGLHHEGQLRGSRHRNHALFRDQRLQGHDRCHEHQRLVLGQGALPRRSRHRTHGRTTLCRAHKAGQFEHSDHPVGR